MCLGLGKPRAVVDDRKLRPDTLCVCLENLHGFNDAERRESRHLVQSGVIS